MSVKAMAERIHAAEVACVTKQEALERAKYELEQAEEAVEDAKREAFVAAASTLVGKCFEWRFDDDPNTLQRTMEMVVAVNGNRTISLKVADADEPGPFAPVIQLRQHATSDLFGMHEHRVEITRESFELLYSRVSNKLAGPLAQSPSGDD